MINFWTYNKEYSKIKLELNKIFNSTLKKGVIFFFKNLKNFEKNFIKKYK